MLRCAAVVRGPNAAEPAGVPPERREQPDGPADDLKRIAGIGQNIERQLNQAGIFHFRQIAALDDANVAWLERHLRLRGRVRRQDWIGQAKNLIGERPGHRPAMEAAPTP